MKDRPPIANKAREGFLSALLGEIPRFVRVILATMFGTTVCFVSMLQLGGLQAPFTNWITSQISSQVKDREDTSARLGSIISRIENLEVRIHDLDNRIRRIERKLSDSQTRNNP